MACGIDLNKIQRLNVNNSFRDVLKLKFKFKV